MLMFMSTLVAYQQPKPLPLPLLDLWKWCRRRDLFETYRLNNGLAKRSHNIDLKFIIEITKGFNGVEVKCVINITGVFIRISLLVPEPDILYYYLFILHRNIFKYIQISVFNFGS